MCGINDNKTGVINDPPGQPTVPAGSDCRLILKFWDGRTDGQILCDHYFLCSDCGRHRGSITGCDYGSAKWIKKTNIEGHNIDKKMYHHLQYD